MIEVTKHGKYIKTKVCPECGCEFTYTFDELNCLKDIKNGERVPYFWYVVCPECKSKVETSFGEHFKVNENEKEIVYIDMDGVIVDFNSGKKHFTKEDYENIFHV